jgi:lipopolysaccharide/colanic/teichoic acid biosynthesis glycosyltransferase
MSITRKLSAPRDALRESLFLGALCLERKRAERSRKPFVLMLLDVDTGGMNTDSATLLTRIVPGILASVREIDIVGWQKEHSTLGVIFAELGAGTKSSILHALRGRVTAVLRSALPADDVERITITLYWFPEDWKADEPGQPMADLYPDLRARDEAKKVSRVIKRGIDVLGSAMLLIVLSPILLAVAIAIKVSSPGPILFRQTRIGRYGVPFTLLKFRSMFAVNDPQIHKDYVRQFIAGNVEPNGAGRGPKAVYKITKDPRLTSVGGFLRRTSLDEFPQFLNVLRGEMSLVGPRPPLRYELEAYDIWHRRRLLEAKPGITGLWQVKGRSRLRFDDMVRLDLAYAKSWSLWLDVKILARTPLAVFSGQGAY